MDIGVFELCGVIAALSAGLGGPVAVAKWGLGSVKTLISDSQTAIMLKLDNHSHKVANLVQRVDSLEMRSTQNVERIVKLETNLTNIEKGQERIEHAMEKRAEEAEKARVEIIDSIRELRDVRPNA